MSRRQNVFLYLLLLVSTLWLGCARELDASVTNNGDEKESGWIGADSYEVGALIESTVHQTLDGEWADLATDPVLQQRLVDLQIKFIKSTAEAKGWRLNQLSETVEVLDMQDVDGMLSIRYRAVVDMLGRLSGDVPKLSQLSNPEFMAKVPMVPGNFDYTVMKACSEVDDGHSVRDYNFHYYFKPEKSDCELALNTAHVMVTEVFDRPKTYPEYDKLMQNLAEGGIGFKAALVPNRGDEDPLSRFKAHAEMLEQDLGLSGIPSSDGTYHRYAWRSGEVTMVIDLFDPTTAGWGRDGFEASFRRRLADYTLVHYNGHSSYGSKHLLDDPESYADAYQIIVLHSCQSFAYYTRQVFRGKATASDPQGFETADIIATGKSSYPNGAPRTLNVLLESLMNSMVAIHKGSPNDAVDWITIAEGMKKSTWGDILYGIAGVRSNVWQP